MYRDAILAGIFALGAATGAGAQIIGPSPAGGPRATMDFVKQAAQSDAFERREGQLVEGRTHNPKVRAFAARMVRDHTRTTAALQAAIRRSGMASPPPPDLSDDQKHMIDQLSGKNGPDLDRTYVGQQLQAHQQALQLMNGYAEAGAPGPIHDAALKTIPLIEHHLEMVKGLRARLGG